MKIKTVIFLVIVTVAQGSLSAESSKSCVPQTNIGADLAAIQFAEDSAHQGLERTTVIIFTEIRSTLTRCARRFRTKTKEEDYRTAVALNETITALEVGIIPTLEAVRTINPAVDFNSSIVQSYFQLERVAKNGFLAIELIQCKNTTGILAKIQALDDDTQDAGRALVLQLFTLIYDSGIPADTNATVTCIEDIVRSEILGALHSLFDGVRLLVNGPCSGKKAGSDDCSSAIQTSQNKVSGFFKSEVTLKFSAVRNILIEQLITKIGIVPGLFAAQAAQAATSG